LLKEYRLSNNFIYESQPTVNKGRQFDRADIKFYGDMEIPEEFRLSTYSYSLPPELIAHQPVSCRDHSRLLIIDRNTGKLRHDNFFELPNILHESDVLVINDTQVIPAALHGKKPTGGKVQLLVLDPATKETEIGESIYTQKICLFRCSGRLKTGSVILLPDGIELLVLELISPGRALIRFPVASFEFTEFLKRVGSTPLPPYIRQHKDERLKNSERYQTIYSKVPGSVAAPTAGLHFSSQILEKLKRKGIDVVKITLHVGPGTFTPIRSADIRLHKMEPESYSVPEPVGIFLQECMRSRRKIIAVGSTSVRTLEASYTESGFKKATGYSDLFIIPGYQFKVVQGMITNFHLPESTLLALVCAFAGIDTVIQAYKAAVSDNYRFYSYGDACLVV